VGPGLEPGSGGVGGKGESGGLEPRFREEVEVGVSWVGRVVWPKPQRRVKMERLGLA